MTAILGGSSSSAAAAIPDDKKQHQTCAPTFQYRIFLLQIVIKHAPGNSYHQSEPSLSPPEETTCGSLMFANGAGAGGCASSGLMEPERARGAGASAADEDGVED
jgi:hypothetical protein